MTINTNFEGRTSLSCDDLFQLDRHFLWTRDNPKMTRLTIQTAAISALLTFGGSYAFVRPTNAGCRELILKALPTPEESAKALSDCKFKATDVICYIILDNF